MIIIFEHEGVNGAQSFNLSYDKMTELRHEATYKQALNTYFPQEIVYRGSLIRFNNLQDFLNSFAFIDDKDSESISKALRKPIGAMPISFLFYILGVSEEEIKNGR